MDKITVIEFATQVPPWRSGEKAGFPHETAMAYVNRGLAKIVAAHVDRVDARTRQADAERRLAELRLTVARLFWRQKNFARSLVNVGHAVVTNPVVAGDLFGTLLRRVSARS